MASALIGAKFRAWANDGTPLAFGKVYTYETGTTVPKVTYTTEAQTTPNANPVILNASGYADIYLDGSYKIVVKDADDVEIHTTDPVSDPSNVGSVESLRKVDTIQDLLAINTAVIPTVLVIDYHSDVTGGGGNFVWDATAVKNTHNGGTIIDPDVTYPTDWTNQAQLTTWFDGSVNVTTGCWIRKYDGALNVRGFGAKGDGTTNDSAALQAAINANGHIYVSEGTYMCGNLLMKDNLRVTGESHAAILKLMANATTVSVNGGLVDTNGVFPGNIFCSTLIHTGDTFYDAGVRALDEANASYIFSDIIIENLTLDGNKAQNQVGDTGLNASAMGAGVSIHQCKNVTVRGCRIINNRMDGVHVGYTLHGGSDHCNITGNYFEGNQRTNIALITGKYNTVSYNSGTATTGGTGVNAGAALDIEANFTDEVNYRHTIIGNRLGGQLGFVSVLTAKLQDTTCSGNVWVGSLALSGSALTSGCVIDGDTFIAKTSTDDWLLRTGPNTAPTTVRPTLIKDCTVSGFARVIPAIVAGGHENFVVEGCAFSTESFGSITRGYRVKFRNNDFYFSGNADPDTIALSNTLGGTVPNQGQVEFRGNKFYGVSNASFFTLNRDASWPLAKNDFMFTGNNISVTGATYTFTTPSSMTIEENKIENFKPISIAIIDSFRFINNYVEAASAENMFANQSSTFNDVEIVGNDLTFVTINLTRPKDTTICANRIIDGRIALIYSFTGSGVGRCHVSFNHMTAKSVIANPFVVTTGGSFLVGDFVGKDQYKYNTYTDYTGGASIAGAMVGAYDGTFD